MWRFTICKVIIDYGPIRVPRYNRELAGGINYEDSKKIQIYNSLYCRHDIRGATLFILCKCFNSARGPIKPVAFGEHTICPHDSGQHPPKVVEENYE